MLSDVKDIFEYYNFDGYNQELLMEDMICFCSEVLCERPEMVVPSNKEGTEAELIKFSIEFLNPTYSGDHADNLSWLKAIANNGTKEQKKRFLKAVEKKLGMKFDINSDQEEPSGEQEEGNDEFISEW